MLITFLLHKEDFFQVQTSFTLIKRTPVKLADYFTCYETFFCEMIEIICNEVFIPLHMEINRSQKTNLTKNLEIRKDENLLEKNFKTF